MISALVQYLDANDAGSGFYNYAKQLGLLNPNASRPEQWEFWIEHVKAIHAHYGPGSDTARP